MTGGAIWLFACRSSDFPDVTTYLCFNKNPNLMTGKNKHVMLNSSVTTLIIRHCILNSHLNLGAPKYLNTWAPMYLHGGLA